MAFSYHAYRAPQNTNCCYHAGPGINRKLEKRDWELWAIVSITGVLVSAAQLAILFHAAFLKSGGIHFELTVSRPLAVGLFVLLALMNNVACRQAI